MVIRRKYNVGIHTSHFKAKVANQIKRIYDWNLSVKRKTENVRSEFNQDFVLPDAYNNKRTV